MDQTSNRVGVELLFTDCDLALTFLDLAANSRDHKTVERNMQNARKAYESVLRHIAKLVLNADQARDIRRKLSELKMRLEAAEQS